MKRLRPLVMIAAALVALYGFGRFFLSQLSSGNPRAGELAAVVFAPPEGFSVESIGEVGRAEAAARLAESLEVSRSEDGFGLHFEVKGAELYWLVERTSTQATLTELAAAPSGTRVSRTWGGTTDELRQRLAWAASHGGDLECPGLASGTSKNLYH